jgi:hypothetical protein
MEVAVITSLGVGERYSVWLVQSSEGSLSTFRESLTNAIDSEHQGQSDM